MSFFLGRKKRDLSNKSRNGEHSKKHGENSDRASSLPDDAFRDGFNSPECTKILINCLKSIELQVKELFVLHEDTKNSQIKGEKQLDSLVEALKLLSAKFEELEKNREKKDKKISDLEKKVESLESKLGDCVDELEQYSRRNCLLIYGPRELEGENTNDVIMKTVKEEMDIDIREEDLDRTHRVGNPKVCKEDKSRPIIIEFARYDVRSAVYKNKKKLKGKSFLITESLTAKRAGLLKEAQGKYGVRNVWTTDGRILYKENNRVFLYKK